MKYQCAIPIATDNAIHRMIIHEGKRTFPWFNMTPIINPIEEV